MKLLFLLPVLALFGTFGITYALSSETPINLNDIGKNCHPTCFEFVPNHSNNGIGKQVIDFTHNQDFTVVMADGSCNITGKFNQATNTCDAHSIILTPQDFKIWQTDIASMYVGNIYSTDLAENVNYCSLAEWSWDHQTIEFKNKYDIYDVIPAHCFTSTPDFTPSISIIVFMSSIIFITVLNRRG